MKFIPFAALLMALTACTTDVVKEPVSVDVAVPVPCRVEPIPLPTWPTDAITDKATHFEKLKAIVATNEKRKGYEAELMAAVASCQ